VEDNWTGSQNSKHSWAVYSTASHIYRPAPVQEESKSIRLRLICKPRNEMHVAAEPVDLGDHDGALGPEPL